MSIIRPLNDDGEPDIISYNKELEQRGNPKWHDVPWLYSECYLCMLNTPQRNQPEGYAQVLT